MMQRNAPRIGIIGPVDLTNLQPLGGLTGFLANVLGAFRFPLRVYGVAVNRKAGRWAPVSLSKHVQFVPVACVRHPSPIPMRLKALVAYSRYRSRILSDGLDLLYIHSVESALPFLLGRNRVPTVYHQHGSHNPVQLSVYLFARLKIFQRMFDKMLSLVHRKSDWVIAIDSHCLDQVRRNGAGHKVTLLVNGVNTKIFRPDVRARERMRHKFSLDKKRVILFAGRLEAGKGIEKIIEALCILNERKDTYSAFVLGEGSQKRCLQDLVLKRHMQHVISFAGAIPHNQLKDFYNMADVLLLPSEREGIPMVVLESLACGTPVIASDQGGISGLLRDGINGHIAKNLSPVYIARAAYELLALNLDRYGVAKSIEGHSSDHHAKKIEEIFLRLTERRENRVR